MAGRQEVAPSCRPLCSPGSEQGRGDDRMRGRVTGEQYAQVDNPDPFASPVWRSPVYRTPEFVIWIVQLARLLWRVLWFVIRHPGLDVTAGILLLLWASTGWQGLVTSAGIVLTILIAFRLTNPRWFTRLITASPGTGGGGGATGSGGRP